MSRHQPRHRKNYLWSLLFTTGYLTQDGVDEDGILSLAIPNREIRWIYTQQIRSWFKDETKKDIRKLEAFCRSFQENDTAAIERGFISYLRRTISIRDTSIKKEIFIQKIAYILNANCFICYIIDISDISVIKLN